MLLSRALRLLTEPFASLPELSKRTMNSTNDKSILLIACTTGKDSNSTVSHEKGLQVPRFFVSSSSATCKSSREWGSIPRRGALLLWLTTISGRVSDQADGHRSYRRPFRRNRKENNLTPYYHEPPSQGTPSEMTLIVVAVRINCYSIHDDERSVELSNHAMSPGGTLQHLHRSPKTDWTLGTCYLRIVHTKILPDLKGQDPRMTWTARMSSDGGSSVCDG